MKLWFLSIFTEFEENSASLMMLNDDCLLYLLEYLNILDLIKIRELCHRLGALIDRVSHKYTKFSFGSLSSKVTQDTARNILMFVGPSVKVLKLDGNYFMGDAVPLFGWILEFCKNLQSLNLANIKLNKSLTREALDPVIQNLKSFTISSGADIMEDWRLRICFKGGPNLEEFKLSGSSCMGWCLLELSSLKTLSVNGCCGLQPSAFKRALIKNTTLKKLEIARCDYLDDSVVDYIINNVTGIEELTISSDYPRMSRLSRFAELPFLKKLSVETSNVAQVDELLEKLWEKNILQHLSFFTYSSTNVIPKFSLICKLTNLKTLSMTCTVNLTDGELKMLQRLTQLQSFSIPGAIRVTSDGVLSLLFACKNIKYLNVSWTNLDVMFLEGVIQLWKKEEYRPKLEMVVQGTNIKKNSEHVQNLLKENHTALKLKFEPKIKDFDD